MRQSIRILVFLGLALGLLVQAPAEVAAKDIPEKEPGPRLKSKLYKWTAKNGMAFHYRLPKKYDAEKGANLTFLLHGSNMDHRWGFANHAAKTFRPDDIVVSPDGTSSNGEGGFNSLGRPADAKKFHALHKELMSIFKVRTTFLYGHSQGSFFAFYYAGQYPEHVQGVVGHASGVWSQTRTSKKGHHQAIVLMHGTQDPVVPYSNSAGCLPTYTDAKYPHARLRSLEWWNHWPAEQNGPVPHTSQQLAWAEGVTTEDPARMAACWAVLGKVRDTEQHDYAGTYLLARHLADHEAAPAKVKKGAAAALTSIDALVAAHIKELGFAKDIPFDDPEKVAHFIFFRRRFHGIPACDDYVAGFEKLLAKHQKKGIQHLKKYYAAKRGGKTADALKAGVDALTEGYLWYECHDRELLAALTKTYAEGKKLKLSKKARKQYDAVIPTFEKALQAGWKSMGKLNAKKGKL